MNETQSATSSAGNSPVLKALRLLAHVAGASEPPALAELARALKLPKPTAFRLARALESAGFVRKAAIAGAIAVGAFAMMQKDENKHREEEKEPEMGYEPRIDKGAKDRKGHALDLAAEAAGAYALGRQMMGYKNHAILKLIAEGLGAAALGRETDRTIVD